MPRIAESYSSSILNFVRNLHTDFHSGYVIYISTNSAPNFPFLHIITSTCYFLVFLMLTILTDVRWYLIVVLIWVSTMANDMEHLFMYLLAICMFSLEKFLFRSSTHFLIKIFVVIDLYDILIYFGY